jgi:probable rRNA maturation factor
MAGRLLVRNLQRAVAIDVPLLERRAERLREWSGVAHCDFSVTVVNEKRMAQLNGQLRDVHKPTDVLSASPHAQLRPNDAIPAIGDVYDMGDVYLCAPYIDAHCRAVGIACLQSYVARLLCHGTLHLCGFTHDDDDDFAAMLARERLLLQRLQSEDAEFRYDIVEKHM